MAEWVPVWLMVLARNGAGSPRGSRAKISRLRHGQGLHGYRDGGIAIGVQRLSGTILSLHTAIT